MKDSFGKEISPRGFIARVDHDFMAANVAGTFLKKAAVNEVTTDSPGKKLGWAIVGLGNLSILERGRSLPMLNHLALEMDHTAGCVMQNKEPITPGEEGLT